MSNNYHNDLFLLLIWLLLRLYLIILKLIKETLMLADQSIYQNKSNEQAEKHVGKATSQKVK